MQQFDVVTIGDSVLDTFLHLAGASDFARIDAASRELCIKTGSKVLLDSADFLIGGNASNVAVGLSRMGFNAALVAEFGDDEFSQKLIKGLEKEKVNLDNTLRSPHAASTFSVILDILGDRTAFIRHVKRNHAFSFANVSTKWLYLTSLGETWETAYEKALDYKKSSGAKLAFNPGSAQIQAGPESFTHVLSVTDILFVNRDEAELILHGKLPEENLTETEENLLFRIQRMGPKLIVMTDGDRGSYVLDENAQLSYEKAAGCKVVEKTGAGDGFASGFLSAMLLGKSVRKAMQYGAANAASVIEQVGAEPGLLTREQIEQRIKNS